MASSPISVPPSSTNKGSEISIDELEIYLENACSSAARKPLDVKALKVLHKLSTLLWQRYQLSREECLELQKELSEELLINAERLRTLTILRRDEKRYQDRLQKNYWLLERVRERGGTHIRIAKEAQELKSHVSEQQETINELKKEISRLKKKCDRHHAKNQR